MKNYSALPDREKEALVNKARELAYATEMKYGNCVQSVLNALREVFPDMGITQEMIKGCFGLAGGCCISLKGTCGALSATAFAVSLFYGRPADDFGGYYEDCHALIRTVMDDFEKEYGGVLCSEVLTHNMGAAYDWKTKDGLDAYNAHDGSSHDASVVAWCTGRVAGMLVDGTLVPGGARPDVANPYYRSPASLEAEKSRKNG